MSGRALRTMVGVWDPLRARHGLKSTYPNGPISRDSGLPHAKPSPKMMVLGHESWDGAVRGPPCDPCGRAARSCDVQGAVVSSGTGRAAVLDARHTRP